MKYPIIYLLITFVLVIPCFSQENKIDSTKQNAGALRQKYGNPVSETFQIRPEIVVIVSYDKSGKVSQMVVEPKLSDDLIKSRDKRIDEKTFKEVFDELAPPSVRGKFVSGGFENIICLPENDCYGTSKGYENVIVYRNGNSNAYRYFTIQWKSKP